MLAVLADFSPGRKAGRPLLLVTRFALPSALSVLCGGAALAKMLSWCSVCGVKAGLCFPCPAPTLLALVRAGQEAKAFSGLLEPKKGQVCILNYDFFSLAVKDPCSGV